MNDNGDTGKNSRSEDAEETFNDDYQDYDIQEGNYNDETPGEDDRSGDEKSDKIDNSGNKLSCSDAEGESSEDDDQFTEYTDEHGVTHLLSAYEIQRLERIKRNKAYLTNLGLDKGEDRPKKIQQRKRERRPHSLDSSEIRFSSRRASHTQVSYTEKAPRWSEFDKGTETKLTVKKRESSKGIRRGEREAMDIVIYKEFLRITSERKQNLKQAEKNIRRAEIELKYYKKKADAFDRKNRREQQNAEFFNQMQERNEHLGGSLRDLFCAVEKRLPELIWAQQCFDQNFFSRDDLMKREEQQRLNEKKMEMIDALDRFPCALKDACNVLNVLLLERAPKDPPPPRRGGRQRKSEGSDETQSLKFQQHSTIANLTKSQSQLESTRSLPNVGGWRSLATAIVSERIRSSTGDETYVDLKENTAGYQTGVLKRKKCRNVGGWVSPLFAAEIDRSWVEMDTFDPKFELSQYVPQIGDTVLYYPNGHREFLKSHPDAVGKALKTVIRQTLWERAEREKAKIMKDGLKKQGVFVAKLEAEKNVDDNGGTKFSSDWWNDEWLEGVKGKLGNYPLVCVVKDVYAEFPPDPNAEHKVVIDDGIGDVQIVWSLPANVSGKKTNKSQASICLVLNLKPLTSLLPPTVLKDPNSNRDQLQPPPNFSVILFPSNSNAKPFLVPFSWAYKLSHSIMLGDKVTVLTMGDMKGTVKGFATVNDSIGSCRFDDRLVEITAFLSSLKAGCEGLTAAPNMDLSSHPQRMSKSLMSFLPVTATFAVIERLSSFLDANSSCPEPMVASENLSDHALSDLIRSTLPIWESVTILSHGVSKSVIVSPWELSLGKAATKRQVNKIFQEATADLVAENGLIHIIEEPLRAKIECALEDFIKSEDDSVIFYDNVTEEIAPSYNCAVPQGMFFAKILRRIATHKTPFTTQPRCYYRTVEALMNDLTTILENCLLYNSPDSDVVHKVYQIIPSSKRIILDLVLKHVRDKDSQSQADNERKNAVLSHTKLSGVMNRSDGDVSKSKSAKKCIRAPKLSQLHGPYLESLHRAWIEDVGPDQTWTCPDVQVRISGSKYTHRGQNWVPQSGDFVLYSRSRHSKFVQAHFDAFTTYQSVLPFFKGLPSDEIYFATKDGSPSSISFDQRQGAVVDNLPGTLLSHWLVGKVVWVRAVFPRVPTKDCTATFKERSPLLSLGIKFEYSWAGAQQTNIIHWRPCTIQSMLGKSALNTLESMDLCDSCGLDDRFAFLYPAWLHNDIEEEGKLVYMESPILLPNTKGRISQPVFSKPNGLEKDEIASIDRCFNTLKRRCLGNISPDYVDPKCCMANIKAGWCPTAKSGRTLPTFERLLEIERFDDADRATSKRKIAIDRKWNNHEEEADAVSLLADIHYLPPLSIISYKAVCVQTKGAFEQPTQEIGRKYEETICPVPKLCLELVQQRLRNGYYRSRNGILNDIQEAYVNSSLLVLSKEASRKFGPPFSMRRIIKALSASDEKPSTKRKSKKRSSEKGAGTSPKAVQHKIVNSASSSAGEKKTSDNDLTLSNSPTQAMKAVNEAPLDPRDRSDEYKELKKPVLSEEENNWTEKVNTVKRLYATALVCVLETVHVERVFGTAPKDTKKMFVHSEETLNREKIFQVARNKLGLLIAAMIKDPCNNRIKGASMELPKVKVNISGLGMIGTVSNEKSNPNHIIFEPLDYFNNKDLIKTLFGKPGMSDSCAHCQVYRRNMLSCRVQRAHSCPDFNWIDVFQDVGGLDALLQMLRTGLPSVVAKSPTLTNDETDTRYTILDSASTNQVVEDVESAKQGNETKDEEYEDGEADFAKDKDEGDPYDNQEKALRALNLSHQILDRARNEVNCPLKLSETFIKSYFPIDPTDGKYTICVVCGLIGDVMCCEGQDCPVVSHPRCVGLEEVPRDDWFCIKCAPIPKLIEGKAESGDHVPMNDNGISDACATYNSTSLIPTAVLVPLYDPEVEEVKRAKEYETLNDELQNILEELKSKRYKPRPKVGVKETEIGANEDNSHDEYDQISQHGKLSIVAASVHGEQNDVENDDDGGVFIQVGSTRASTIQANIIPRKDVGGEVIDTNSLAGCMSVSTETLRKGTSAITVGSKISKHFFDQGDFTGIIKQLPTSDHPYYCVRYDDGDEEDLSENELQDLLFLSSQKKSDWLNRSDISIGSRAPKSGNFDSVDEQASEEPPHQRLISRPSKVSGSHRRGRPRGISKADPSDLRLTSGCKFSGMISAIGPIGQESERNDNEIFHSSPLSKRRSAGPTRQKLNKDVHISHHSLVKKKGQTNRENGTLVSGPMATPRKRGRPRKNKVEEKAQCTPQSTSDISNGESLSKKKKTEHSPLSLPRGRQRK